MSMFSIFSVSGSAISAQSQRLNVVASNLANVDAVAGPDGQTYKARQLIFQTTSLGWYIFNCIFACSVSLPVTSIGESASIWS